MVESYVWLPTCLGLRMLHEGQNKLSAQGVHRRALNWGIRLPLYLADNPPGYCCMSFTAENAIGLVV